MLFHFHAFNTVTKFLKKNYTEHEWALFYYVKRHFDMNRGVNNYRFKQLEYAIMFKYKSTNLLKKKYHKYKT